MKFSMAQIREENSVILRTFDHKNDEIEDKIIDLEALEDKENQPDILFYSSQEQLERLGQVHRIEKLNFQIENADHFGLELESFQGLEFAQASEIYAKSQNRWLMTNNIRLIETVVPKSIHLKNLWKQDRGAFFEELWNLLRINLGTSDLRIVYNDVEMPENDDQKPKLIKAFVYGQRSCQIFKGTEVEDNLMKHYEADFKDSLSIMDLDLKKGEIVYTISIEQSPVLIMGKLNDINQLQQSVIKSLIEGTAALITQ